MGSLTDMLLKRGRGNAVVFEIERINAFQRERGLPLFEHMTLPDQTELEARIAQERERAAILRRIADLNRLATFTEGKGNAHLAAKYRLQALELGRGL